MAGSARAVEREPRIRPKYTRPFSSREVGSGNETIGLAVLGSEGVNVRSKVAGLLGT